MSVPPSQSLSVPLSNFLSACHFSLRALWLRGEVLEESHVLVWHGEGCRWRGRAGRAGRGRAGRERRGRAPCHALPTHPLYASCALSLVLTLPNLLFAAQSQFWKFSPMERLSLMPPPPALKHLFHYLFDIGSHLTRPDSFILAIVFFFLFMWLTCQTLQLSY